MNYEFGRGARKCATCNWHQDKAEIDKNEWIGGKDSSYSGYCHWRQPISLWAALKNTLGFHWMANPTLTTANYWCSGWKAKE